MSPRPAAERRALGLWTAGCLAVLLSLGVTWLGDWALQWPLLLVPAGWALVTLLVSRERR
jgi:hypothetical protein